MQQLIDSYGKTKDLHHAYFLIGEKIEIFPKLKDFLEKSVGVKTSGNPDFSHMEFQTLTIDDAREISLNQERKDFSGNKKIFIISADFITQESQNSLLKVFEEPTPGTHFFIISPQDMLLPTLRSRMQVIFSNMIEKDTQSILKLKLKDRLAKVKEITEAISDEESTKQDAIAFLNEVEAELYEKGVKLSFEALKICEEARASLYDRGAPVKIILENLMLSI